MSECINLDEGVKRVMGQKPLYFKMLNMFLESTEFGDLKRSLDEKNIEAAANASHAIKGIAGNLSLTELHNINLEFLECLRGGNMPSDEEIEKYNEILETTRSEVRQLISA